LASSVRGLEEGGPRGPRLIYTTVQVLRQDNLENLRAEKRIRHLPASAVPATQTADDRSTHARTTALTFEKELGYVQRQSTSASDKKFNWCLVAPTNVRFGNGSTFRSSHFRQVTRRAGLWQFLCFCPVARTLTEAPPTSIARTFIALPRWANDD